MYGSNKDLELESNYRFEVRSQLQIWSLDQIRDLELGVNCTDLVYGSN